MQDTASEDSVIIESKLPCDECGSSDARANYDDGHGFCFSCDHYYHSEGEEGEKTSSRPKGKQSDLLTGEHKAVRGLSLATVKKWGVQVVKTKDKGYGLAFPYYDKDGNKVAQKIRTNDKDFMFLGETKKPRLFGQQLWSKGKKIVITEGEIDAMSVAQLQGNKWPVVSVPTGAKGAVRAIGSQLAWLEENFEDIVLMFDMDDAGQDAAREVALMFSPGKCKIAQLPLKDANECLNNGESASVIDQVWNAKEYRPDGIVSVADVLPRVGEKPEWGIDLPWKKLYELTYGILMCQVWVWLAGSGMGKTEFFKAMIGHILKTTDHKVGAILLEEEAHETVVDIAGKVAGKCFNSPNVEYDEEEKEQALADLANNERLYLYDHFGHDDYNAVKSTIRHMVAGLGCKVIFLDHLTVFTDGAGFEANAIGEKIMKELSSMTRELNFNLQVISHTRKSDNKSTPAEEGGRVKIDDAKGSGAIKQWSNVIIGLERDQQAEDVEESRTTTVRVLKSRKSGQNVGQTLDVLYEPDTGSLIEVDEIDPFANEGE